MAFSIITYNTNQNYSVEIQLYKTVLTRKAKNCTTANSIYFALSSSLFLQDIFLKKATLEKLSLSLQKPAAL